MADLATFDTQAACDKGYELELRHPATKAPTGSFITVLGADSTIFKDHMRKRGNARLRQQFAAQRRNKEVDVPTFEQAEKEEIDLLAAVTVSWRSVEDDKSVPTIEWEGKHLQFSTDNAKFLYAQRWIREQVDEAVGDLENFMPS